MNSKQKVALLVYLAVIAVMCVYPPWKEVGEKGLPLEYAPIFAPPVPRNPENGLEVDLVRLLLQAAVVSILSGGLMAVAAQSRPGRTSAIASSSAKKIESTSKKGAGSRSLHRSGTDSDTEDGSEASKNVAAAEKADRLPAVSALTDADIKALELSAAVDGDGVVIRLPTTKSYGEFLVESEEDAEYWEFLAEARGAVKLPIARRVQLEMKGADDVDLSFISVLQPNSIYSIDLSNSKVRDWELANLAKLTDLRELDLSGTGVSSQAVNFIGPLSQLEKLWLDETQIDDGCFSNLKQFTRLKKLSLKNTKLSTDVIKKLKEALPECMIEA